MNRKYVVFKIHHSLSAELLIQYLDELGFDGIFENENWLEAYAEASLKLDEFELSIYSKFGTDIQKIEIQDLPDKNWNEEWEANFEPVYVDKICAILADFHDQNHSCKHSIALRPKMAFGTGHHETTYMMIEAMNKLDLKNSKVFDFGTGTGILSVFASQLGAAQIIANDIQAETKDNFFEHMEINNIETSCTFYLGGIEYVKEVEFDFILANINKPVLMESAEILYSKLNLNGILLISGILKSDLMEVSSNYIKSGFEALEIKEKGNWHCVKFQK